MSKNIEFSIYSYTKNIRKLVDNYSFTAFDFTEKVFRNENRFVILREYEDKFCIIEETYIEKYKTRKYLCKSVKSSYVDKKKHFVNDFTYFVDKFQYTLASDNVYKSWCYKSKDVCIEIYKQKEEDIYLLKASSFNEKYLDNELVFLELWYEFKKPIIEI